MGTPEFAVYPLKALLDSGKQIVAVVTVPDKPVGRGQKVRFSPVKEFALKNKLPLLQPTNLKDDDFIETLRAFGADLQIVVAFRMLPEAVWNMPRLGTVNLHASLLPSIYGSASGFLNIVCITRPATERAAPVANAVIAFGRRKFTTISR